ncbi:MAG TPA: 50S ribosomal protein L11 methyltransferase [Desulfuromonadaceae bacterium]|nr:50S ribosomal protein L11 methyltransferase [Desulfuromonadaceae bacterium]
MKRNPKQLWKISVATTLEAEDAVMELLGRLAGGNPSAYFDLEKGTSIVSTFRPKTVPLGVRTKIRDGLGQIRDCGLDVGNGKVSVAKVRRLDWAESWKRHFKPLDIGGKLLVKPSWNKKGARRGQVVIVLDPGLSFGTGQHPTTSFCLQQIVAAVGKQTKGPKTAEPGRTVATKSFLDIGTGSGILAIAAAKLGFQPVEAFDFDPEAVRIAKENARNNGVRARISRADVTRLPVQPVKRFDLVCANLISNLLVAERKKIVAQLAPGGVLVLAGILQSEFGDVQKAFESMGLRRTAARSEKEWRSGAFSFA